MRVLLHVELESDEDPSWWAESPDRPEFSGAADSLKQLVELVRQAAHMEEWGDPSFKLAPPDLEQDAELKPNADESEFRLQVLAA